MFDGVVKISDLPLPYDKKRFSYYDKYIFDNVGYIDPNLLLNEKFQKDKSMDIYSLGILLWEIMSGKVPYSDDKDIGILQLVLKIKKDDYREKDINCTFDNEYINLFKKCFILGITFNWATNISGDFSVSNNWIPSQIPGIIFI